MENDNTYLKLNYEQLRGLLGGRFWCYSAVFILLVWGPIDHRILPGLQNDMGISISYTYRVAELNGDQYQPYLQDCSSARIIWGSVSAIFAGWQNDMSWLELTVV